MLQISDGIQRERNWRATGAMTVGVIDTYVSSSEIGVEDDKNEELVRFTRIRILLLRFVGF